MLNEYRKKVGGLKLNELPGLEALQTPGLLFSFLLVAYSITIDDMINLCFNDLL